MIKIFVTETAQPDRVHWVTRVPCKGEMLHTGIGTPATVLEVSHYAHKTDPAGRPDFEHNVAQAVVHVVG